ncbi:MAG: choice-of-anchor D domain-containing protein [Ignavibacteriales bacterium]|nr:MAG: choice-of-anchor D domain-containing protein [Ignavibacteriales bacterium]
MHSYTSRFSGGWYLIFTLLIGFLSINVNAQVTPLWEKSQLTSSLPSYIGTANNERGIGYGVVNSNPRLYVATVTGGAKAVILNALTGDSVGVLSGNGITGGTLTLTDIEVSSDGVIFGANLVTSSAVATPFKIYKWANEAADPVVVAQMDSGAFRLGDKFTVVGSTADNSIIIYAVAASNNKIVKFTTTDNGATFNREVITATGLSSGTAASLAPINNGVNGYWVKGGGSNLRRIKADNTLYSVVHADFAPTNGNAIRYFESGARKFLAIFQNGVTTTVGTATSFYERVRILEVINDSVAVPVAQTSRLGTNTNTNASGDVAVRDNGNGTFTIFAFATNNGVGAYTFDPAAASVNFNMASTQDFEDAWVPGGWARYTGFLNGNPMAIVNTTWGPDDFGNVTSPVDRSARVNIFGTSLRHLLASPTIDLGSNSPVKQVEFNLALTNYNGSLAATLGPDDTLAVVVSTDNGVSWLPANTIKVYTSANVISNTGQTEKVSLAGYTGQIKIGFYAASTVSNADNDLFIDDFKIGEVPLNPVYSVVPEFKDFGVLQTGTTSAAQTFTITNNGAGDLVVSGATLTGSNASSFTKVDNNTYPATVTAGQSITFTVAFSPADTGAKSAVVIVGHNAAGTVDTLELSGSGVDFTITTFPYVQNFDSTGGVVPPPGWYNPGNFWGRGTEAKSLPYAARVAYNHLAGTNGAILQTPLVNLPANAKITFWWKDDDITAGRPAPVEKIDDEGNVYMYEAPFIVGQDTTYFEISTDMGATWTTLGFLSAPAVQSAYEEAVFDLAAYAGNGRLLRWRDQTNASFSAYGTGLDDIVIEEVPQITMDWHNLQWPATANIVAGNTVTVYTQGWENNVTPNPGPDSTISVWIGVSNANTNPNTWTTWVPAVYNTQQGNNDEYMADIGANLAPGTYYYASRWQLQNGPYTYGGYSTNGGGFWDGTTNVSGVLTVTPFTVSSLPYSEGFEGVFPPTGWTLVDVNGGTTWIKSNSSPNSGANSARYNYSGTLPGNDWLIAPATTLQAGKTYRVIYYYKAQSATYPEKLKVAIGSAPVPDSLYTVLADHPNVVNATYELGVGTFQVPVNGNYYIGFQAYSLADQWYLFLDDVAIVEVPPVDYAVAEVKQLNAIPVFPSEGVNGLVKGEEVLAINPSLLPAGERSGLENSTNIIYGNNTYTDNGLQVVGQGPTPFNVQANVPVSLDAYIANAGLTNVPYVFNSSIAGVNGTPINRPGVAPGSVDTVNIGTTVLTRGTVSTVVTVTAEGDTINSFNNTGANHKTLVYPDSTIRNRYDNGQNLPNTFIGFSTNNISLWGAVRFTAQANVKLTNVDAYYRTEASSDSVMVGIWGPGATTSAPGPLLYMKKFGGVNYLSSGGAYVTLPLGDDAPGFQAGTDYWISLTFNSEIQFPLGAHNSPLTTPGRSYISADTGKTWSPLVVTTERAWFIRSVGVAWQLPALTTSWEKSKYKNNLPSWFSPSGNTERGFGYGVVGGNQRLYVVSRNAGLNVRVVNAITGNDAGILDVTGIAGGTFALNDAGVTMDGKIIAANLRTTVLDTFRVYMWNDEATAPVKVVDYAPAQLVRLGDKITVVGDFSANTAEIWAASATAGVGKVYIWKMTGGAFNALPDSITLSDGAAGGSAAVGPIPGGGFYWNSGGNSAKRYAADGTLLGTVPGTVVATGTNAIRYVGSKAGVEYFATYQYGAGNENGRVVGVPAGDFANAFTYGITPTMGNNSNAGGTGDLEVRRNPDGTVDVFVLGTNNGFGLYHTTAEVPVELTSFAAAISGSDVVLNWSTASEVNNSGFSIERKAAGESFTSVSFVEGKGNTAELSRYTYTDKNVTPGVYTYRLKQIDFDGTFSYSAEVEVNVEIPGVFELAQNYPNPFNPSTTIKFALPKDANVTLSVYSVLGEKVATIISGSLKAGNHVVNFDATKLSTGLYIYKLEAGEFSATKKMMFLK